MTPALQEVFPEFIGLWWPLFVIGTLAFAYGASGWIINRLNGHNALISLPGGDGGKGGNAIIKGSIGDNVALGGKGGNPGLPGSGRGGDGGSAQISGGGHGRAVAIGGDGGGADGTHGKSGHQKFLESGMATEADHEAHRIGELIRSLMAEYAANGGDPNAIDDWMNNKLADLNVPKTFSKLPNGYRLTG
jgi:hypothetical protein